MDLVIGIVVAGLVWHALLIAAIYAFDLGGGEGIPPTTPPEAEVLDGETFSREFQDD